MNITLKIMVICATAAISMSLIGDNASASDGDYRTLLFIDRSSVDTISGSTFSLNQAKKHPMNPLLVPGDTDKWDSLQVTWPATVIYSPTDRMFRCWYAGFDAMQVPGRYWQSGYAESKDGINWKKPDLGQATYLDRPTNRIVLPWNSGALIRCVFENPGRTNPTERFGCLYLDRATRPDGAEFLLSGLGWSSDGKTWVHGGVSYEAPGNDRASYQDICQILFDPEDPDPNFRVKGFTQILRDRSYDRQSGVRNIGLTHGEYISRVVDATSPILLAPVKGIDEELHGCSVMKVGNTYLMLFESDTFSTKPLHGDLKLAISTDGRSFHRVHDRTPLVATGPRGTWDENLLINTASSMQVVGDEIFIYYIGCPNVYTSWPPAYAISPDRRGSMFYPTYLGLATLPRDRFGFASGKGTLVTRPIEIGTGGLWLNVEGKGIAVEAMNPKGKVISRGKLGSKTWQSVYLEVIWNEAPPKGSITLRFKLDASSKLYSMRY
ncbi:MAG: hypothetical protein ACYC0V_06840 [Armatimonadota bacterium]